MDLALYTHRDMLDHRPGVGHPERPERLAAVLGALADASDLRLEERQAPLADPPALRALHAADYVEAVLAVSPARDTVQIDPDTWMSAGSPGAAAAPAATAAAMTSLASMGRSSPLRSVAGTMARPALGRVRPSRRPSASSG